MTDETRLESLRNQFSVENRVLDTESYRVKRILQEVDADDRVLDVGCVAHSADMEKSDLWLHGRLDAIADSVVGIDIDPQEVASLQEKGYDVRQGDAEDFEFGHEFDTVVAGELLEHLSNPGRFLECTHESLAADGNLVLSTPNPWTLDRTTAAILSEGISPNPDHTAWYDRHTIETLLQKNGFEAVDIVHLPPPQPAPEASFRFVRNNVLRLAHRAGFEYLGGPEMVVVAEKTEHED